MVGNSTLTIPMVISLLSYKKHRSFYTTETRSPQRNTESLCVVSVLYASVPACRQAGFYYFLQSSSQQQPTKKKTILVKTGHVRTSPNLPAGSLLRRSICDRTNVID